MMIGLHRSKGETIPVLDHLMALLAEKDLRDQQRFEAQSSAITAALLAAEKAVSKAETANERRFESVNEFRSTLSDQAATFIARTEFDAFRERYAEGHATLMARVDKAEGRTSGAGALWGYLAGAIGILVAIVSLFLAFNR
jgi:hypothetical protein